MSTPSVSEKANTVRVRIFVSVDPEGGYVAKGSGGAHPLTLPEDCSHQSHDFGYWIEADLPVPGSQPTITATVTRA